MKAFFRDLYVKFYKYLENTPLEKPRILGISSRLRHLLLYWSWIMFLITNLAMSYCASIRYWIGLYIISNKVWWWSLCILNGYTMFCITPNLYIFSWRMKLNIFSWSFATIIFWLWRWDHLILEFECPFIQFKVCSHILKKIIFYICLSHLFFRCSLYTYLFTYP